MIHSFKDRRLEKFFRNGKTTAGIFLLKLLTRFCVDSKRWIMSRVSGSYYPTACVMNA